MNFKSALQKSTFVEYEAKVKQEKVNAQKQIDSLKIEPLPVDNLPATLKEAFQTMNATANALNDNLEQSKQAVDAIEEELLVANEECRLANDARKEIKNRLKTARANHKSAQDASEQFKNAFAPSTAAPSTIAAPKKVTAKPVAKQTKQVETFCTFCKADDHSKEYCDLLKNTECTNCGVLGHTAKWCSSNDNKCHYCNKPGHFARNCYNNPDRH